uniref:Uncharacterized protein n=1 Tax=Trichobilharzia regenti TaxID=157069 RepID=A0AA85J722_TRIRE|nr:unnamed protein product [Trichobilharzia regenti]
MSLYYCAISNEKSILCHHSIANRNYENVVRDYLGRNPPEQDICFSQGDVSFHCITVSGLSFIAATDQVASRQQSRNLVVEISQDFCSDGTRLQKAKSGPEGCLQYSYGPTLQQHMVIFLEIGNRKCFTSEGSVQNN